MIFVYTSNKVKAEEVIIPNSAIRLRVLPNSNAPYDQEIKKKVRDKVQQELYVNLKDTTNIEEARTKIQQDIPNLKQIVTNVLKEENEDLDFSIDFGNHYFPEKIYKGLKYEEGDYESLLITLGEGQGDNWWCVLFPPLCLIEAEESNGVEYKSFVKELIDKYL